MESRFDRIKKDVLQDLRNKHKSISEQPGQVRLNENDYDGLASSDEDRVELRAVLRWMMSAGLIVPGDRALGFGGPHHNDSYKLFPYFSLTEFGLKALDPANSEIDPHERGKYLSEVLRRMPDASTTMRAYVGEASATYEHQHYLAAAVLIGVAAEDLVERLYKSFAAHLKPSERSSFEAKLNKERWASPRLKVFRNHLGGHTNELPPDLVQRIDTYLDVLIMTIKTSRDDVGHGRPARIDRDIAHMNLVSYPSLVSIVAELERALKTTCVNP